MRCGGVDPESELYWAEPSGSGTERFKSWNMALYWKGDLNGVVSDYVRCYNGEMPDPDSVRRCTHKFTLPEWGARVSFEYPRSKLSEWREMKAAVRGIILGFERDSEIQGSKL